MGADTTTMAYVLKEVLGKLQMTVQQKATAFKIFSKSKQKFDGKYWREPITTSVNPAAGIGVSEGGTLPTAGNVAGTEYHISPKFLYGAINVGAIAMIMSKDNAGAFIDALTLESNVNATTFTKRFNTYLWGAGNGLLGVVDAVSGTTIDLERTGYTSSKHFRQGANWINVGDVLAAGVVDDMTAPRVGAMTVTAVTRKPASGNPTIVVNSAATDLADGDSLYLCGGTVATHTKSKVPNGLLDICDDGTLNATFQNVTRSSYPTTQGNVMHNSGTLRTLTEDLMTQACDKIRDNSPKNDGPDSIWCHPNTRREYVLQLQPDRRFAPLEVKGGTTNITFSYSGGDEGDGKTLSIKTDLDCPEYTFFFLNKDYLKYYEAFPIGAVNEDGIEMLRGATTDVFDKRIRWVGNFGSNMPSAQAMLTDISVTGVTKFVD